METKIREIQPLVADNWMRYDPNLQDTPLVQPVPKSEKGSETKVDNEEKARKENALKAEPNPEDTKELVGEVDSYLKDLNIQLNFNIEDKTGDLVVKVMNRETGDVIRQIPPESLLKLREKLKELRGVLFDGKV